MKKALCLMAAALMLTVSTAAFAQDVEDPYPYEGKDFYYQEIPQPRASYIPDGTPILGMIEYAGASNFDSEAFVNSEYGKLSSTYLRTNYAGYTDGDMDENLLAYWAELGVTKEQYGGETEDTADNYYVYTPSDMDTSKTYPLMIVSHGGGSNCFAVEGMGFINMIPEEQFILATAEDTSVENLYKMYQEVVAAYPVDVTRVYASGTSMGGMASVNIAVAYPELIAAIAPNDILPSVSGEQEQLDKLSELRMPMQFNTGLADKYHPYPVASTGALGGLEGYNTLLEVCGFEEYTVTQEESAALVSDSLNIIEHYTGLKFPSTEIVNYENNRMYRNAFTDENGVVMLSINVVENKPHMFVGYDAINAWNFVKQFSRDPQTGALSVIE